MHDRNNTGQRDGASRGASDEFRAWTLSAGLTSTFKHRHPMIPRFTYQNGSTKSALDDIYISTRSSHQIKESGIWLYSLNKGDHVGTPFICIGLDRTQRCSRSLRHVQSIKVIDLKKRSPGDMCQYEASLKENLASRKMKLIESINGTDQNNHEIVQRWLESAIQNLYVCTTRPKRCGAKRANVRNQSTVR